MPEPSSPQDTTPAPRGTPAADRGPDPGPGGRPPVAVAVAVVVGCALRLTGLGVHSLWFDEVATVQTALDADPLARLAEDRHPPLAFLAFRGWAALLGPGDTALRLLPALLGCGALALFALAAVRLLGRRGGTAAAALWAVAPFHVWISQEVRMYAFVELAAVAALAAQTLGRGRARLLALAASGFLAVGSHYMGVLVVAAAAGVALARATLRPATWRSEAAGAGAVALGALAWTPWILWMVPRQLATEWGFQARLAPRDLAELPVRQVLTELDAVPAPLAPLVWGLGALLLAGLAWSAVRAARAGGPERIATAAWATPVVAALVLTALGPANFTPRYLVAAAPGFALAVAGGLAQVPPRRLGLALASAAVLGSLGVTLQHRRANHREDYRTALAEVAARWRPGDGVLSITGTPGRTSRAPLEHYLRDAPGPLGAVLDWEDVAGGPYTRGRLHVVVRGAHYTRDRLAALRARYEVLEESPDRLGVTRLLLRARP